MFMNIVTCENNFVWENLCTKNALKFENMMKKENINKMGPEIIEGVVVGDKALDELEKGVAHWNESEVICYDDVKLNQDEKDILSFPPDHQIYPKVTVHGISVQMDKCIFKSNWDDIRNRENKEQGLAEAEAELSPTKPKPNILSLTDIRATSWKNNKQ